MKQHFRTVLLLATVAASLAVPASAHAILVGAESNGELVNSDRTPALQAIALDKMRKQGVQVVRVNWGWNEVATPVCAAQTPELLENHENTCYNWVLFDSLVSQATARNMRVLVSISRVPVWVSGNADPYFMGSTTAQFQKVMANFAAFHKAAATRYAPGSAHGTVNYWTVYNEPNSDFFWKPAPNPQRYAALYAATAKAIKAASPSAQVAPGPTNPRTNTNLGGIRPVPFIKQFQRWIPKYLPGTSARKHINAWAHNPYPGFNSQPSVPSRLATPDSIGMGNVNRLYALLDSHPSTRGTKVWATEFGWETSGTNRTTLARQAQFIAEAFHWLDASGRVTIGIQYGLTDPTNPDDWQSGTFTASGATKPAFKMFQRMISIPQAGLNNRVRRGTPVKVWARSNVAPSKGVLAFKRAGDPVWRTVPGQRRKADGTITATLRATDRWYQVAVYDTGNAALGIPAGYGLTRNFATS